MQITVKQLNRSVDGKILAVCSTDYGDIKGIWRGEEPEISKSYFVEFNVQQKLVWGVDILAADNHEYRTWIEKNTTFLLTKKEVCDEFKSLLFRLGDHLMQVETEGEPISGEEFYGIRLKDLLITS